MTRHEDEWFPWLLAAGLIVAAIMLVLIDRAYGGPRERIAIAEAAVWVAQNQFPAGENDYDGSQSGKSSESPNSSIPHFEFPADIEPISVNVEPLTATVYTAEQFNGDGWCSRCNILKRDWGNGDDRLRLVWSRDRVPEGGKRFTLRFGFTDSRDIPCHPMKRVDTRSPHHLANLRPSSKSIRVKRTRRRR